MTPGKFVVDVGNMKRKKASSFVSSQKWSSLSPERPSINLSRLLSPQGNGSCMNEFKYVMYEKKRYRSLENYDGIFLTLTEIFI